MHTEVRLHEGVVFTSVVTKEDVEISQSLWREAITPAVYMLQMRGGGTMFVPHNPDDLLSD